MTHRTIRRGLRLVIIVITILACLFIFAAAAIQFGIHTLNQWQTYSSIHGMQPPEANDSVVVFAPHSDDETLGCGGVLSMAKSNNAKVKVVLLTNGDGFRFAAARTYKTVRVTHQRMIDLAYRRQGETLNALQQFGLSRCDVEFLGYPDRGLAKMWEMNWSPELPYTSKATGWNYVGYDNAPTRYAPYCGESLLEDIEKQLIASKPTFVFIPHPLDNHSDHYGTYCFVTSALEQLASEGQEFAKKVKLYTYLVHRGDWPSSNKGADASMLMPPHSLIQGDTSWISLTLPDDVIRAKRTAIMCYKTQTNLEKTFLLGFARPNEIFGIVQSGIAANIPQGFMQPRIDLLKWRGIVPVATDPVGDYVMAEMSQGGDVRSIYAATDKRLLFLRTDFAGKLSKRITYSIAVKNPDAPESSTPYEIRINKLSLSNPDGLMWFYRGNSLQVTVPLRRLGAGDHLYIQITTKLSGITVDNTGWRTIQLLPAGVDRKAGSR